MKAKKLKICKVKIMDKKGVEREQEKKTRSVPMLKIEYFTGWQSELGSQKKVHCWSWTRGSAFHLLFLCCDLMKWMYWWHPYLFRIIHLNILRSSFTVTSQLKCFGKQIGLQCLVRSQKNEGTSDLQQDAVPQDMFHRAKKLTAPRSHKMILNNDYPSWFPRCSRVITAFIFECLLS